MNYFRLEHRGKKFKLTPGAYKSLTEQMLVDPMDLAKRVIDLFVDANVDFDDLHMYVSEGSDKTYVLNYMALCKRDPHTGEY